MKKILTSALILLSSLSHGQSLSENKIDDFTGHSVKRTSWDKINNQGHVIYTRSSKIDSLFYLGLKITRAVTHGKVFAMSEGASIMFKMEDGTIVELHNSKYAITGLGDGAVGFVGSSCYGIDITCIVTDDNFTNLKNKKATKIRFYTTEGYAEYDLKEKFTDVLQKQSSLLQ